MTDQQHETKDVGTTGHSWDGIEELNNPLPRWWLWSFYATIFWGVIYTIAYPAWPLVNRATEGYLGYSTRAEVAADISEHDARNADLANALASIDPAMLAQQDDLNRYAVARGAAVFRTNCSQCHGAGAAGVQAAGYPNLLDDDWLWGGSMTDIALTIRHGIRNDTDPDARWSEMPAFGEFLSDDEIDAVVAYVQSLSGQDAEPAALDTGAALFAENCSSCHGEAGLGDFELGAPSLADAIWLYGGSDEAIEQTVRNSRFGVMPAWGTRLSDADINALAAYVHGLGGGE